MAILYKYELKKLFFAKVNLIALAGSVIMLVILAMTSVTEDRPASREAAKELDGRTIDGQLFEEIEPAMEYESGVPLLKITEGYEKYVPILNMIMPVTGDELDLTRLRGMGFYDLRRQKIDQRLEKQGLTAEEKAYWDAREDKVRKPFVYRYHSGPGNLLKSFQAFGFFILLLAAIGLSGLFAGETADSMNQLLLCSRHGKRDLYKIKLAAGFTWMLAAALAVLVSVGIPVLVIYGAEGMGEQLQLVKPLSMLSYSIGRMLAIYLGIYLMAAVLFAAVTMFLSVVTQNRLAVAGGMMGYLLIDLFASPPDRFRLLQKIWALRPNAVLMNTGFSNYRLIRLAGRFFLNCEAAPAVYVLIAAAALVLGWRKYLRLQVGR